MMGFHPSTNLAGYEEKRLTDFFSYADAHLASSDQGPVVYTTLSDITKVFAAH